MKCPRCENADLLMAERAGVEIDYCPTCRGVWLDRGELDKIIERSYAPASQGGGERSERYEDRRDESYRDHHDHHDHHDKHCKRRSWLQDIFD